MVPQPNALVDIIAMVVKLKNTSIAIPAVRRVRGSVYFASLTVLVVIDAAISKLGIN